jgi:BirA family transcriptional regulator, biotin operon repressor / biotin---[acetyl-CoA-carboxylase] ligase
MYANPLPKFFHYSAYDAQMILQKYTTNQVIWLDTIDSTNDYLKRIVKNTNINEINEHLPHHSKHKLLNLKEPVVCLTWEQTAGHGQFKRVWHSQNKQCLMLSMLLPLNNIIANKKATTIATTAPYPSYLSLICGLSLCEILQKFFPDHPIQLKWPNDIILQHKKLGGLLVEYIAHAHENYLLIGLGLNWHTQQLNVENSIGLYASETTKLGTKIDLYAFIASILDAWENDIPQAQIYGFQAYIEQFKKVHYYEKYAHLLHSFSLNPQEKIQAYYHSIDNQGYLYIQMLNGEILRLG